MLSFTWRKVTCLKFFKIPSMVIPQILHLWNWSPGLLWALSCEEAVGYFWLLHTLCTCMEAQGGEGHMHLPYKLLVWRILSWGYVQLLRYDCIVSKICSYYRKSTLYIEKNRLFVLTTLSLLLLNLLEKNPYFVFFGKFQYCNIPLEIGKDYFTGHQFCSNLYYKDFLL